MQEYLRTLKFSLLNIGYAKLDINWDYDNVISPFSRLYLITSGVAYVYHNKRKFHLKPGYMYLIPSNTYSGYKCNLNHEQYYISFLEEVGSGLSIYSYKNFRYEVNGSVLDDYCFKRLLEINPNRTLINDSPSVYDNESSILYFNEKNEIITSNFYVETQGLLKMLFSKFIKDDEFVIGDSDLNSVIVYISKNLHKELTVNELAIYSNLSKDYFSKKFNEKFKMRPSSYIELKRIERAQLLLLTTKYSLQEIGHKVGLDNATYFSRVFKKVSGMTPTNFRKQQLGMN